jgi:PIN domain nuclease of toxin-antitoxin system
MLMLDSHVLHWWSAQPERLSPAATRAVEEADELAVAAVTWYELAWLARHERIIVRIPVRSWLERLAEQVRTLGITPAIAEIAVSLPASFPRDPADRQIYATAVEHGLQLISKDERLRTHPHSRSIVIW